jgi:hypothetical protein
MRGRICEIHIIIPYGYVKLGGLNIHFYLKGKKQKVEPLFILLEHLTNSLKNRICIMGNF